LSAAFWLYALYFPDQDRTGPFLAFSLLALSNKEEMGLILALVGGYAIFRKRRWILELTFVTLGLAWFFVGVFWLQPAFSPVGENVQFNRYRWLGNGPAEMVATLAASPVRILTQVWDRSQVGAYLLRLLAPLGFMSLLDPLTLILTLPSLAVNLLSDRLSQTRADAFLDFARAIVGDIQYPLPT